MPFDIVEGIKSLLSTRIPEINHLEISWFGGEPLLAKEIVLKVSSHVAEIVKEFPSLVYESNMTTNGSLLNLEIFEQLCSLGVNFFQISLDGDCEVHNQTRKGKGEKDTFNTIWENLLKIRDSSCLDSTIMLRIHYSPNTWNSLSRLINLINLEFSDDSRFKVYFKSIEKLGSINDSSILTFSHGSKQKIEKILKSQLKNTNMIYRSSLDENYICYASKANSLIVRSDGNLAKCTVALYNEKNVIGKLNSDGSITINDGYYKLWLKGLENLDPIALSCSYTYIKNL